MKEISHPPPVYKKKNYLEIKSPEGLPMLGPTVIALVVNYKKSWAY